jgi:glutamate racemase
MNPSHDRSIGIFDSGVGGLTVARSVIDLLPNEHILYFGDTARGPYGPRDLDEVADFAFEIMDWLVSEGSKMIVMACNTASAAALDQARAHYTLPLVDVLEPAVRAAVRATRNGRIGVIGTQATIRSGRYDEVLAWTRRDVTLVGQACPRFVEMVETGQTYGEEVLALAREYLEPVRREGIDTLILGCTHYPLLTGVIQFVMGPDVVLVSSAEVTAVKVYEWLTNLGMLRQDGPPPERRFACSGDGASFKRLCARFLGPEVGGVEERRMGRAGESGEAASWS